MLSRGGDQTYKRYVVTSLKMAGYCSSGPLYVHDKGTSYVFKLDTYPTAAVPKGLSILSKTVTLSYSSNNANHTFVEIGLLPCLIASRTTTTSCVPFCLNDEVQKHAQLSGVSANLSCSCWQGKISRCVSLPISSTMYICMLHVYKAFPFPLTCCVHLEPG